MAADSLRRMADNFVEMESIREHIVRPPRPQSDSADADSTDESA
jgi:hypothetical protein